MCLGAAYLVAPFFGFWLQASTSYLPQTFEYKIILSLS